MAPKRNVVTKRRKALSPGLQDANKMTKRSKALRPGLEKAKKQQCELRERVLTARAVAAGASKVTYRQGVQLYGSSDGGNYFVLYKREPLRLEVEGGALRSFDGAYYHASGEAGVDGSNYKETCHWSSISEIEEWLRSSRRGDGVTGNLFMSSADRAFNFTGSSGHPVVREGMTKKKGFWLSLKGNAEARKQATSALRRLSENLKDPTTRGATLTLMKQTHSLLELVASGIFAALRGGPRVARQRGTRSRCTRGRRSPLPRLDAPEQDGREAHGRAPYRPSRRVVRVRQVWQGSRLLPHAQAKLACTLQGDLDTPRRRHRRAFRLEDDAPGRRALPNPHDIKHAAYYGDVIIQLSTKYINVVIVTIPPMLLGREAYYGGPSHVGRGGGW
jgi:hypothetical protein